MVGQWLSDPWILAVTCGAGTALITLARRLGARPKLPGKKPSAWEKLGHALSGACLAGGIGSGVSLLLRDMFGPEVKVGVCLILAALVDLSTSEGRQWAVRIVWPGAKVEPLREPLPLDEPSDG